MFNERKISYIFVNVLKLMQNLPSILKINDVGVHVTFDKSGCMWVRGNLVLK